MKSRSILFAVSGCILTILATSASLLALGGCASDAGSSAQKTESSAGASSGASQPQVANTVAAGNSTSFPVREILPQLKGKTQVRIFLPSSVPFSDKVYYKSKASANGYSVEFNYTPDCKATACYMGAIEAEKGGKLTTKMGGDRETLKNIQLAGSTKGIFYNACGAYCTALVEWQSQGVLYRVTMKNGREEALTKIANSAIEAGVR